MVNAICRPSADGDGTLLRGTLHTLKGNAAVMGLSVVARLCHVLEDELADPGHMKPESLTELSNRWRTIAEHVSPLFEAGPTRTIEVPDEDYAALVSLLTRDAQSQALQQVLSWQLEPASRALGRLANQARALAERLGKGELLVETQSASLRLDAEAFTPFFSDLGHIVRNAVDHGLEYPEEREAAGKPRCGRITLKAEAQGNLLCFEISDDGRGIDWDSIRKRGIEAGLPADTAADLLAIVLRDGVTTRSEVTLTSGRGVGMGAVKQRIDAMHGRIEVHSSKGTGTRWVVRVPWTPKQMPERLHSFGRSAAPPALSRVAPF